MFKSKQLEMKCKNKTCKEQSIGVTEKITKFSNIIVIDLKYQQYLDNSFDVPDIFDLDKLGLTSVKGREFYIKVGDNQMNKYQLFGAINIDPSSMKYVSAIKKKEANEFEKQTYQWYIYDG